MSDQEKNSLQKIEDQAKVGADSAQPLLLAHLQRHKTPSARAWELVLELGRSGLMPYMVCFEAALALDCVEAEADLLASLRRRAGLDTSAPEPAQPAQPTLPELHFDDLFAEKLLDTLVGLRKACEGRDIADEALFVSVLLRWFGGAPVRELPLSDLEAAFKQPGLVSGGMWRREAAVFSDEIYQHDDDACACVVKSQSHQGAEILARVERVQACFDDSESDFRWVQCTGDDIVALLEAQTAVLCELNDTLYWLRAIDKQTSFAVLQDRHGVCQILSWSGLLARKGASGAAFVVQGALPTALRPLDGLRQLLLLAEDDDAQPAFVAHVASELRQHALHVPWVARIQGEFLLKADGEREFLSWFADASAAFPNDAGVMEIYARFLEIRGRWREACTAWMDAFDATPLAGDSLLAAASCARKASDWDRACAYLRYDMVLNGERAETYRTLARVALGAERLALATEAARGCRVMAPDEASSLILSADIAEASGCSSLELLTAAAEMSPKDVDVLRRLYTAAFQHGEWDKALAWLDRIEAADPYYTVRHVLRIDVLFARGDVAEAYALIQTAHGLGTPMHAIAPRLAQYVLSTFTGTAERLRSVLDVFGSVPNASVELATAFSNDGHYELAHQALESALSGAPDGGYSRWIRVKAWLSEDKDQYADSIFADTQLLFERYHVRSGLPALMAVESAAAHDPELAWSMLTSDEVDFRSHPVWSFDLAGRLLEALGREEQADNARARIPSAWPDGLLGDAGFLINHGYAHLAVRLLRPANQALPDHKEIRDLLAKAMAETGDEEQAWALVQAEEPSDSKLHLALRAKRWADAHACAQALVSEREHLTTAFVPYWYPLAALAYTTYLRGDVTLLMDYVSRYGADSDGRHALWNAARWDTRFDSVEHVMKSANADREH